MEFVFVLLVLSDDDIMCSAGKAQKHRYQHRDASQLATQLQESDANLKLIGAMNVYPVNVTHLSVSNGWCVFDGRHDCTTARPLSSCP